mgnify:CR=1 FL=1
MRTVAKFLWLFVLSATMLLGLLFSLFLKEE